MSRVGRGIGRGIAVLLPVLLITTFLTFLLGTVTGQDPAASVLGDNARPEDVARMRGVFGLDRPFIVRYWDWLWDCLHGDLGSSWFTHIPVADSVMQRLPVSLSIAFFALLLATFFGTVLGILAALSNGGIVDRAITLLASVLSTIPGFVAAIGLIVILSVTFPVFPSGGYVPPSDDPWMWIKCLTLPAIALSLDTAADLSRQLRTGPVDVAAGELRRRGDDAGLQLPAHRRRARAAQRGRAGRGHARHARAQADRRGDHRRDGVHDARASGR